MGASDGSYYSYGSNVFLSLENSWQYLKAKSEDLIPNGTATKVNEVAAVTMSTLASTWHATTDYVDRSLPWWVPFSGETVVVTGAAIFAILFFLRKSVTVNVTPATYGPTTTIVNPPLQESHKPQLSYGGIKLEELIIRPEYKELHDALMAAVRRVDWDNDPRNELVYVPAVRHAVYKNDWNNLIKNFHINLAELIQHNVLQY